MFILLILTTVIADLYQDFLTLAVVDRVDEGLVRNDPRFAVAETVMSNREDRIKLADACLNMISERSPRN